MPASPPPRPTSDGGLRLAAVEYVVLQEDWHAAGHLARPQLLGTDFAAVEAGNRYGLPAIYALHAWIWEHNPSGTFPDWSPRSTARDGWRSSA